MEWTSVSGTTTRMTNTFLAQVSHNKNYNAPIMFLMFRGIEYDF